LLADTKSIDLNSIQKITPTDVSLSGTIDQKRILTI